MEFICTFELLLTQVKFNDMKKGMRIINALSIFFNVLFVIGIIGVGVNLISGIFYCLSSSFESSFEQYLFVKGIVDLPIQCQLSGGETFESIHQVKFDMNILRSSSIGVKLLLVINQMSLMLSSFAIIWKLRQIFESLSLSVKQEQFFEAVNCGRIRFIGYVTILYTFITIIVSLGISHFVFDGVLLAGKEVKLSLDYSILSNLYHVAIIFVIAEVYRVGVWLKEERDLVV